MIKKLWIIISLLSNYLKYLDIVAEIIKFFIEMPEKIERKLEKLLLEVLHKARVKFLKD